MLPLHLASRAAAAGSATEQQHRLAKDDTDLSVAPRRAKRPPRGVVGATS